MAMELFGYDNIDQLTGSFTPISATVDGVDTTKARLWTTTAGSLAIWDGVSGPAMVDPDTNILVGIGSPHHKIHEGDHYYMEGNTTLGTGEKLHVKLVTPDSPKWAHFKWEISSTGVLTTTFDEDASDGMADGTPVIPLNNDRNSNNNSGMSLTSNVGSAATYVTRISNQKFGVASNPSKATGGGAERDNEIILKQDTIYIRNFESSSDGNIINFRASWYEHTNK